MYLHTNAKLGLAGRVALVRAIEDGLSLKAARRIVGCQGRISMRRRYAVVTAIGGAVAAYVLLARPRASPVGNDRSGVLPAPSRRRPSQNPNLTATRATAEAVSFVMSQKMLRGIRDQAERTAALPLESSTRNRPW
jgi:hypothetical protein